MSKLTYCSRIFDPYFVYLHAARQTGEHYALKAMLDSFDYNDFALIREEDFEKVYPMKTFYHHYKRNIGVLTVDNNTYRCQTFKDGIVDISFDLFKEKATARKFFAEAEGELTVIDFFSGKEINPNHESVMGYAESVLKAEKELSEHNKLIQEYRDKLTDLKKHCDSLYACSTSVSYKTGVCLLENYMETIADLFYKKHQQTIHDIELYLSFNPRYESELKTLGLYLHAINYGLKNKRFLKRCPEIRPATFNKVLSDCRKFIAENEGIVDKYIAYMNMNRNERENLIYMLSQESLITNGSQYIGDDLFC